jgi:hypothetical protein
VRVVKIIGYALVETNVSSQLRRHCRLLKIAPDYPTVEATLGAQGFGVLQETYAERQLARTARLADDASERRLKLDLVKGGVWCFLPLTLHRSKYSRSGRRSFIPERDGRLVMKTPSLEKGDLIYLVFELGNYRYHTSRPHMLDFLGRVFFRFLFQNHVPYGVKID